MRILHKNTGKVLWESPCAIMRATVETAVVAHANLSSADLRSADLRSADLRSANLRSANLRSANLRSADLRSADLRSTDLSSADLSSADLSSADLSFANLRSADLRSANLSFADLRSANLSSANLSFAKSDFLAEVLKLPNELEFLRDALIVGKVNGSTYEGECACLAGTLAHAKGILDYRGGNIRNGCEFIADSSSPRECFFLAIKTGDTPETNGASQVALDWTNEAIAIRDNIRSYQPNFLLPMCGCKIIGNGTAITPFMIAPCEKHVGFK